MQIHVVEVRNTKDEDCVAKINGADGININGLCDRIWLREKFPFDSGWAYHFSFCCDYGLSWEGSVLEKGIDKAGNYILFLSDVPREETEFLQFPLGTIDVEIVLSPDMIKGSDELVQAFGGMWPSFHETTFVILERKANNMVLRFSDGYLGVANMTVDLKIYDVVSEDYGELSLDYFTEQWLSSLSFRKRDTLMEVLLCNDYIDFRLPEGADTSIFDDPEQVEDIEFIKEEHISHGVIKCRQLEITVNQV